MPSEDALSDDGVSSSHVEVLAATAVPQPTETAMPEPTPFRVLAYVTSSIVPETIPYDRLTHINYAFLIPNEDGSFAPMPNGWKLKNIVTAAHEAGVEVFISVGGWGWEKEFEVMAADPAARNLFVENLVAFVDEYGLDGVDMDWEYPLPGDSAQNFVLLSQELRAAFPDKQLTTAVVSYGATGEGMLPKTFALYDTINVMTYDGAGHGTMQQFNDGLAYWLDRGVPAEKLVMGIPFYSRPGEVPYRKIVAENPEASQLDNIEWNNTMEAYNGIPTVQEKTRLALENAGGIMFWVLDQDTLDDLSLLKAIDDVVSQAQ
ncbi:MAG: glycoside hydrolase family 18 protein [Anaerolineae bacterium]|nr:glycoside hydrolase family 18 protein [Anaerolineae bacterium]